MGVVKISQTHAYNVPTKKINGVRVHRGKIERRCARIHHFASELAFVRAIVALNGRSYRVLNK